MNAQELYQAFSDHLEEEWETECDPWDILEEPEQSAWEAVEQAVELAIQAAKKT